MLTSKGNLNSEISDTKPKPKNEREEKLLSLETSVSLKHEEDEILVTILLSLLLYRNLNSLRISSLQNLIFHLTTVLMKKTKWNSKLTKCIYDGMSQVFLSFINRFSLGTMLAISTNFEKVE